MKAGRKKGEREVARQPEAKGRGEGFGKRPARLNLVL